MEKTFEKLDKIFLFFVIYTVVFLVFFKTLSYTLPFVLAFLFAFFLRRPTRFLMRKFKFSGSLSSLITSVIFYTILFLALTLLVASIISEISALTVKLTKYISIQNISFEKTFEELQKHYSNLHPSITDAIESNLSNITTKLGDLVKQLLNWVISFISSLVTSIPYLAMLFIFTLTSTYFFTKDISSSHNSQIVTNHFNKNSTRILYIFNETKKMIFNYLKSYLIVIGITFLVTLIGFLIFGVDYAFILSLLCAILDLLPIVGMAMVYVPLIFVYAFVQGNIFKAVALGVLYLIVLIVRQIIEPKIVSSTLDIHPVAVLASFFIGLKIAGFTGMIYCLFLVVFYNIFKKVEVI
ncbi:MAG: sporulation integral membrane protein YtvI [Clostridiales bacterium]|uniref:sporulation integral membrane protein YtvI n=1 Tax=Clostridium sp. N3C TaxID=1776758 RepID=UPI00092DFA16|nr:sporulation integral membrane protein YtvI [Clostridium sp. N3C]NLZ49553.1 sporulation integral membrane protein YtvI [Clostridiales bacterium]SCN25585.1 pheromone autoinducer 2 transporter [Clostridium sp. N3C]